MEGERFLDRQTEIPKDFYSTKSFTDRLLAYLSERNEKEKEKPFFAYLAFTAPHWPLQAPQDVIRKYKGMYDEGPNALRWQRLASLQKLGLVPQGVSPAPVVDMNTRDWDQLTPEERAKSARCMETYAAMVDQIDLHLGRVFDYLRETGELDNTFVAFMSDNGAEGHILEAMPILAGNSVADIIWRYYDNSVDNIGNANSNVWYGPRWACAATAPSRGYKHYTTEGGIRCPCIVRYPPLTKSNSQRGEGAVSHSFTTVMDIMPTILDLAGIPHPAPTFHDRSVAPMRGKSCAPLLSDPSSDVHSSDQDFTGWELFGCCAVRHGDWKAVLLPSDKGSGEWELYNLKDDPGETRDLARTEKAMLGKLISHYEVYYQESGMFDAALAVEMMEKRVEKIMGGFGGFSPSA